jgi:exodeoxyribonuclease VII large subunit
MAQHQTLQGCLHSLSPLAVLNRGYALVFSEDGTLVKKHDQVKDGELLTTRLASGTLQSRVTGRDQ